MSLNNIGCDIKYIDDDLSLPLIINPSELKESGTFEIDGTLSSQYISGLMFGVSYLLSKNNFQVISNLKTKVKEIVSKSN